ALSHAGRSSMRSNALPAMGQSLRDSPTGASGCPMDDYRPLPTTQRDIHGTTRIPEIVPGYETDMPRYDGILSDSDIWAVLSFIESSWRPEVPERQQRLSKVH